jgi:DNA-binding MarR family transcriptional regulator
MDSKNGLMSPKYVTLCKEAKKRDMDSEAIALLGQFFTLYSALTDMCVNNLNQFELLEGRFVSMLMINDKESTAPHEISTLTGLTRASITSTIDSLEARGFAVREASRTDRRSLTVKLTAEGKDILDQAVTSQLNWLVGLTSSLNENEKAAFKSILTKIGNNI